MPQHGLKMDENSLHPTFPGNLAVGLNLKTCHLNIEGISTSKSDYLSCLMREHESCVSSRVVLQFRDSLQRLALSNRVSLIPDHSGIHGKEDVDALARTGSSSGNRERERDLEWLFK
jgi:hypothetical protein